VNPYRLPENKLNLKILLLPLMSQGLCNITKRAESTLAKNSLDLRFLRYRSEDVFSLHSLNHSNILKKKKFMLLKKDMI